MCVHHETESTQDGPRGILTSRGYRKGASGALPLSDVDGPPALEPPWDVPTSLAAAPSSGAPASQERYAGGRRPDAERWREGTGPPSACRSEPSPPP